MNAATIDLDHPPNGPQPGLYNLGCMGGECVKVTVGIVSVPMRRSVERRDLPSVDLI